MAGRARGAGALAKAGVPMIAFMVGGSFLLAHFMQTHMEIKDKRQTSVSKRKFDLEEEHKSLMKKLDIDNFSLSRIPRPEGYVEEKRDNKTMRKKT